MKLKKILAGIFGIGVIFLLLLFVNSLVGNPVSKLLAKKAVQKYIDTNYKELNLEIEKCAYNFKFSNYYAFVQSSTSIDTVFSVDVDSFGNVLGDDYEYEVANNFTTYRRLDEEMRKIAVEMFESELDYDFDGIFLRFVDEADFMELERDMILDIHNPPLPLTIDVNVFSNDVSFNKIAEIAVSLKNVLEKQNVPVVEYNVRIMPLPDKPETEEQGASWINSISLSYFPANRMSEENLPQFMEQFEIDRVDEVNKKYKK